MQINNFYSKQPSFAHNTNSNDYAYQLLKNPDMAKTKTERNFIRSFNLSHPYWENDQYWVHRLKQDTVTARMNGKYHVNLLDFDIPDILGTVFSVFAAVWSANMLIKNHKGIEKITKSQKLLYSILLPLGVISTISSIKYIFTGRHLFTKNKEKDSI